MSTEPFRAAGRHRYHANCTEVPLHVTCITPSCARRHNFPLPVGRSFARSWLHWAVPFPHSSSARAFEQGRPAHSVAKSESGNESDVFRSVKFPETGYPWNWAGSSVKIAHGAVD